MFRVLTAVQTGDKVRILKAALAFLSCFPACEYARQSDLLQKTAVFFFVTSGLCCLLYFVNFFAGEVILMLIIASTRKMSVAVTPLKSGIEYGLSCSEWWEKKSLRCPHVSLKINDS